jgi:hypothetical protein
MRAVSGAFLQKKHQFPLFHLTVPFGESSQIFIIQNMIIEQLVTKNREKCRMSRSLQEECRTFFFYIVDAPTVSRFKLLVPSQTLMNR